MRLIFKEGKVEIWEMQERYGPDYYVFGLLNDPRICPSISMAREVAAGALAYPKDLEQKRRASGE